MCGPGGDRGLSFALGRFCVSDGQSEELAMGRPRMPIQALHGACQAAEELADTGDSDFAIDLATPASILSPMLRDRISSRP